MHLVGFIIRIYHDARLPERQKRHQVLLDSGHMWLESVRYVQRQCPHCAASRVYHNVPGRVKAAHETRKHIHSRVSTKRKKKLHNYEQPTAGTRVNMWNVSGM